MKTAIVSMIVSPLLVLPRPAYTATCMLKYDQGVHVNVMELTCNPLKGGPPAWVPDGAARPKGSHTFRPTVTVRRFQLRDKDPDSRVAVSMQLYEGDDPEHALRLASLGAHKVDVKLRTICKAAAEVDLHGKADFRPADAPNPFDPSTQCGALVNGSGYDLAFGDAVLNGLDAGRVARGGPPLMPDLTYHVRVRVSDFDTTPAITTAVWDCPCSNTPADPLPPQCTHGMHVTFAVYGAMKSPLTATTRPNGCWTWDRPGQFGGTVQEYWTRCGTLNKPADSDTTDYCQQQPQSDHCKGREGTGQWVYDDTRVDQPTDDANFIVQCAAHAVRASSPQLTPGDTKAYVYMGYPHEDRDWRTAEVRDMVKKNSREARYFAELYGMGQQGHSLGYDYWLANFRDAYQPMISIVGMANTDMENEVKTFCQQLTARRLRWFGIYSSMTVDVSTVVKALNDCTTSPG